MKSYIDFQLKKKEEEYASQNRKPTSRYSEGFLY